VRMWGEREREITHAADTLLFQML